ncbi:hypothetical protein SAMN04487950_0972 [Halogranum rubrum]|uniref:Uncharacterized protein n=1 Tax=Halogranum rubrum TaxID=553466 RepID=A0A1I4C5J2_9EURY|nr:hypothetical protein [Halogranum rubrum]SFK76362.1 hypothetical protein SAMN04487950_0972 [Halogranum rubrum]
MVLGQTPPTRAVIDNFVRRAFVVELGIVVALFVGFHAFTIALDNVLDPYFLDSDTTLLVVRSVLALAGMGVITISYASWRGYSLPVSLPNRTDGWLIAAVVPGTAVLATLPFLLLALRVDVGVSHVASTVFELGGIFFNRRLIRVAYFVSGMVLLYHVLIQGALQRVFDHDRNLTVVVTTLLGGYLVASTVVTYGSFTNGPWVSLWGARAAVAVLFVLALGIVVYADERSDASRMHGLGLLATLATLVLAVFVLMTEAGSPEGGLVVLTRAAVVGLAAYTYDRTESLVSPTLVYATYAIVSTVFYSAVVAAVLGT